MIFPVQPRNPTKVPFYPLVPQPSVGTYALLHGDCSNPHDATRLAFWPTFRGFQAQRVYETRRLLPPRLPQLPGKDNMHSESQARPQASIQYTEPVY